MILTEQSKSHYASGNAGRNYWLSSQMIRSIQHEKRLVIAKESLCRVIYLNRDQGYQYVNDFYASISKKMNAVSSFYVIKRHVE